MNVPLIRYLLFVHQVPEVAEEREVADVVEVLDRYASIASLDQELENEKWAERTELITRLGRLSPSHLYCSHISGIYWPQKHTHTHTRAAGQKLFFPLAIN